MTGVVGNVTTCVVIARNSYMHTATNYYLFSLAISDTLSLVLGEFHHSHQTTSCRDCREREARIPRQQFPRGVVVTRPTRQISSLRYWAHSMGP